MAFWLMVASAWQVLAVDPIVSNVQAKQREGSRLVDITYDVLDQDSPTLTVYLKVFADGGATWKGPVELVSGDVGQGIVPGAGKRVVWDAGKEMPNQFGRKYRYRIGASDWSPPEGMALIPAGPFKMGDDRVGGATPVHTVTVTAFAMDKWEVSIELWERIRAWGNAHGYDIKAVDINGPANYPVGRMSWFDAVKWCNARSEKEGQRAAYYENAAKTVVYRSGELVPIGLNWDSGYRLPTEAEWEKAARGGVDGKLYPWGTDDISLEFANFWIFNTQGLRPIGSYSANGYGLYDMSGNAWEWCWDWYLYEGYSSAAQTNPRGPTSGTNRLVRGGSWVDDMEYCRVARRYYFHPKYTNGPFGLRCVMPAGWP